MFEADVELDWLDRLSTRSFSLPSRRTVTHPHAWAWSWLFEGLSAPDYDVFVVRIDAAWTWCRATASARARAVRGRAAGVGRRPDFNVGYHVRHTALPAPGGRRARRAGGRLFSQQLDRDKPLWEIRLIDGVADGHFALICKNHDALVDGIPGATS